MEFEETIELINQKLKSGKIDEVAKIAYGLNYQLNIARMKLDLLTNEVNKIYEIGKEIFEKEGINS